MDVRLPKLGEGAEGGTVVSLFVNEGDQIAQGQTILELENEKAVAPIPSPAGGAVSKLRVKVGDKLTVGQVILTVTEKGTAAPTARAEPSRPGAEQAEEAGAAEEGAVAEEESFDEVPETPKAGLRPVAAPSIRKLARELDIDLSRIRGSERGGRIVLSDVRAYIQRLQKLAFQPKPGQPAKPMAAAAESIDFSKWGEIARKPMSPLRKTISRRMVENWNAIPHVTQFEDVDITGLMDLRKRFAPEYEKKGARLTLTSFALKAAATALKKHPVFNASLDEIAEEIVLKEYYHIGLAVDTEQGLIVPIIRDVDKKNLFQLSKDISELADKARDRKVSAEDLKGGTFTISNQGGIGGAHFTPIINKPDVAILGLGKGVLKPAVRDGKIEARLLMPIALSYDHRVIDGAAAARFTVDLVQAFTSFTEADLKLG
jgi:pyruvate dehydrogenase E2 component (dihydrolipoamide acetyltransferase)